jgi:methyl-accepting chemotaxis protein
MNRTSIKNKLILSFLSLLLIVMTVVALVNFTAENLYLGQAISTVFALAFGVIFGNIFSNSLTRRLSRLSHAAKKISGGDLSQEISLLSHDEVRDLEEVFAMMLGELRGIVSDMLYVSVEIQHTNTRLADLAQKVLVDSEEIDQLAEAIAKGSEDQTIIAQKTSLKMESGLEAMQEMVRQSAFTVSKINEAKLKTEKGESNARKTLSHLETVLQQMIEYSQPIYSLSNRVEKIKLVMNVIDEVAQKTDILSLNASIEASRAGELGKGFALVADEIRSMASNAKESSKQIEKIMEEMLKDNRAVIEALSKSRDGITKGREIIHDIVDTFSEMLSGVKDIFSEVKEVEQVTGKQVKQMKGILTHFQQFSKLASENFVSTQKTSRATKNQKVDVKAMVDDMTSLKNLSEKMIQTQQRFKLPVK